MFGMGARKKPIGNERIDAQVVCWLFLPGVICVIRDFRDRQMTRSGVRQTGRRFLQDRSL